MAHAIEWYHSKMGRKPERKPDDPEQSKRFIDAAREAEADETAEQAFKKVVSPKRQDRLRD